ncbi:hypothetical protein T03_7008, partial [Trichinella britovi]
MTAGVTKNNERKDRSDGSVFVYIGVVSGVIPSSLRTRIYIFFLTSLRDRSDGSVFGYIGVVSGIVRCSLRTRIYIFFLTSLRVWRPRLSKEKQRVQLALRNRCFRTRSNALLPRGFLDSDEQ